MIQRIQTLFLLSVVAIALLMLLYNPIYANINEPAAATQMVLRYNTTESGAPMPPPTQKWLNTIFITAIALGALMAIFMFKKRPAQMRVCLMLIIADLVLMGIMALDYFGTLHRMPGSEAYPGFHIIWPIAVLVLLLLARNRIKRDENTVLSMDRIR